MKERNKHEKDDRVDGDGIAVFVFGDDGFR